MTRINLEYNVSTEAQYRHVLIPCLSEVSVLARLLRIPESIIESSRYVEIKPESHRLFAKYLSKRPDISIVIYQEGRVLCFPVELKRHYYSVEYERKLNPFNPGVVIPDGMDIFNPIYLLPFASYEDVETVEALVMMSGNEKSKELLFAYKNIDLIVRPKEDPSKTCREVISIGQDISLPLVDRNPVGSLYSEDRVAITQTKLMEISKDPSFRLLHYKILTYLLSSLSRDNTVKIHMTKLISDLGVHKSESYKAIKFLERRGLIDCKEGRGVITWAVDGSFAHRGTRENRGSYKNKLTSQDLMREVLGS